MGVHVEILHGQLLHVAEHILAQTVERALRDVDHQPAVQIGTKGSQDKDGRQLHQCRCQRVEVGMVALRQGHDIVVDERTREERRRQRGHRRYEDAHQHGHHRQPIVAGHITYHAHHDLRAPFGHFGQSGMSRAARTPIHSHVHSFKN